MQRTGRKPVKVRVILPADDAEAVQVEMRVLRLQRIKGPSDQPDAPAKGFFALKELQHAADPAVPIGGLHARHVGVQKRHISTSEPRDSQRVANQAVPFKCAQNLTTSMGRHDKHSGRLDFECLFAPDFPLELHALVKLLNRLALAHHHLRSHHFPSVSGAIEAAGWSSAAFVAFQSASIFSLGRFLNSRPAARAASSMARNRLENFALDFFSAISGSVFKKRERFTAAKSKSPNSSSILCWSRVFRAFFNSSVSSAIFSKTPAVSSQSNPMRAALRVSWKPSRVAGRPRETPSNNEAPGVTAVPDRSSPVALVAFERRSSALMCSQFRKTSAESFARISPKTCG